MDIVVKGGPEPDFGDMGPEFTKEMVETSLQAEALNKAVQLSGGKKRKSKSKKNPKKRNLKKNTKKVKKNKGKSKRKSKGKTKKN